MAWPRASHFFLFLLLAALVGCRREPRSPSRPGAASVRPSARERTLAEAARLEAQEAELDRTVWAKERLAERYGQVFERLWDALNHAPDKLNVAGSFAFDELDLPVWGPAQAGPDGIQLRAPFPAARQRLTASQWRAQLERFSASGWRLVSAEFRHRQFDTDASGRQRWQSRFSFCARLTNSLTPQQAVLEGGLVVDWRPPPPGDTPVPLRIDATSLAFRSRAGQPPMTLACVDSVAPIRNSKSIDPLLLADLDGGGRVEVILPAVNLLYSSDAKGVYHSRPLCRHSPGVIYSAILADFDGDGFPDLLFQKFEGLVLFKGSPGGAFDAPGRLVWPATHEMRYPMAIACGDIDEDGDLDLFLAQYKLPYEGGQMPTPFYDANDGYPSLLLRNDGGGRFTDATAAAGLVPKSHRRTYSASFADLDGDGHLDLVVASDFAGVDLYRGDGHGRFSDVTEQWLPESHLFGMAQTLADFNADGRLDFFVSGMPSPTADRLEHLGLWRPDASEDRSMRARMTHGNRLYLARPQGGFDDLSTRAGVDRSGWSWGCTAGDFDNDGFPDLYVANGMESRLSVREYEGEYWLHDAYVGTSEDNPAVSQYLHEKVKRVRGSEGSYGGYEANRLFLNRGGSGFLEAGHLLGVALEADCRNVMADDLDGDGRLDLVVTGYGPWPDPKQRLWIFENDLPRTGHWIGLRFPPGRPGPAPSGATATLRAGRRLAVQALVTGEGYRSQHSATLHFGLGAADAVDEVEIRWTGGKTLRLKHPAIDRYYDVP